MASEGELGFGGAAVPRTRRAELVSEEQIKLLFRAAAKSHLHARQLHTRALADLLPKRSLQALLWKYLHANFSVQLETKVIVLSLLGCS